MQHQLLDIFCQDHLRLHNDPIYESDWEEDQDVLIMQEDGSAEKAILPRQDPTLPIRRINVPLFSMIEPWKLSHQAPPGLQRKLETFLSNCLEHMAGGTIHSIGDIATVKDGHIVCGMDMRDKREQLEAKVNDRHLIYVKGLPSNTIVVCDAPEYTGVLAIKSNDVPAMPITRQIGSFLVLHSIRHYKLRY
jgi:hypothetical protein